MSEEARGPQTVTLPHLHLDLSRTEFHYDPARIAHFQAQEAPQVAGVDPSLFLHPDGGDAGVHYA